MNASTTQSESDPGKRNAISREAKTIWEHFRADRPGERFKNLYRRRREKRTGLHAGERWVIMIGGAGLALVGLILVPAPGPGWLVVAMGLGLLGSEVLSIARFLDASECKLRGWASAARKLWRNVARKAKATNVPESSGSQ